MQLILDLFQDLIGVHDRNSQYDHCTFELVHDNLDIVNILPNNVQALLQHGCIFEIIISIVVTTLEKH